MDKNLHCTLIVVLLALMTQNLKGDLVPPDRAKQLQEKGYSTDTPEQIIEAAKSEGFFVRRIALELLTQRIKEKAIPTLKEAVNDPIIEVRVCAAHWLGTLGDKSGLERMKKDLKELAPNNGAPIAPDPNEKDPRKIKDKEEKRNLRLYNALKVAKVLAELDDRQGYELAARMAIEGSWRWQRYEAIFTLIEIAKTNQATLRSERLNPVFVLCAVAESEKDENVIYSLANQVRENLNDDIAIQILEAAKKSPNLSEKCRRVVQMHIDKVEAKNKS